MWKHAKEEPCLEKAEPTIARPFIVAIISAAMVVGIAALAVGPLQDAAYAKGYDAGYSNGQEKGYSQGLAEGEANANPRNIDLSSLSLLNLYALRERVENAIDNWSSETTAKQAMDDLREKYGYAQSVSFSNGQILKRPSGDCLCPLTVQVRGSDAYYVYLDSKKSPSRDMAFMVASNRTAEVEVPIGEYEIYYATGEIWYGTDALFGNDTRYYKCDGTFKFYDDGEYYQGWTLELYMQTDGNLDSDEVDASAFPG